MNGSFLVLGVAAALGAAACSRMPAMPSPAALIGGPATVHVEVPAKPGARPVQRDGRSLSLALADFADGRGGKPGRKVGDIRATVRGMHGDELLLDEDVAALVGGAVRSRLAADGFRVVPPGTPADFTMAGTVRALSLNVAGRDERLITVEATLRDAGSGDTLWAGVVTDQDDRFAGVNGNSRNTIAEYLGEGVADVAGKLSGAVRDNLTRAYPQTMAVAPVPETSMIPGVTTLHAAAAREPAARAAAPAASVVPAVAAAPLAAVAATVSAPMPAPAAAPAGVVGQLSIQSSPARAKVYVEDVYFGLSPLKVEMPVGVRLVRLKLDGYQTVSEKVSVRRGETTEMEVRLEK